MTPERWQQIDKLFEQALEQESGERAAFLDAACAGDDELRREIESLLTYHNKTNQRLDQPAFELTAKKLAAEPPSLLGQSLGPYQIQALLGTGGMGEVYKARDTRLNRTVAIKAIPRRLSDRADLRRRFVQEAKAASALNHPNIITIHDILHDNGRDFIVMEYVDGKTLDRLLPQKGMPLPELFKVAIQIADALATAHAAGIVHRDLKPGNIMVTERGQVTLLDFGLSKLVQRPAAEKESATETRSSNSGSLTEEGAVLGTAAYMSPEQAEGKDVDARSDIFSFGSLLYEMVTGKRAFQGDSQLATLTAILREEPKPASQMAQGIPSELDRVLQRCLRKDRERRFQSIADVKVMLEELRQELDSGSPQAPDVAGRSGKPRWMAGRTWVAVLTGLILAGACGFFFLRSPSLPRMQLIRFTSYPGKEKDPALSPDGKRMAFAWDGESGNNFDIYVQSIRPAGELPLTRERPVPLTSDPGADLSPAWSPDGLYLAFVRVSAASSAIYVVPSVGGEEKKLIELYSIWSEGTSLDWSPDGKFLVTAGKKLATEPYSILRIPLDTREQHNLTAPTQQFGDIHPAFSPDGRSLAFTRFWLSDFDLYLLPLNNGQTRRLTQKTGSWTCAWTADGREIVFGLKGNNGVELWKVSVSGSKPQPLGIAGVNPTISRQGDRLAYVELSYDTDIWKFGAPGSKSQGVPPAKLVINSSQEDMNPQYSPDGKSVAFVSTRSGSYDIWVCDSEGKDEKRLTAMSRTAITANPRWSPDGREIVFNSAETNRTNKVFVVSLEGVLTEKAADGFFPSWSQDGRWIYFGSTRSGDMQIWRMPAEGGEAVRVTKNGGYECIAAPDGKTLYYSKLQWSHGGYGSAQIWRVPLTGGEETQVFSMGVYARYWTLTERGIYFIRPNWSGNPAIEFFSFATGRVTQVVALERPPDGGANPGLSVSPDGRWILCALVQHATSDIMLVENFR